MVEGFWVRRWGLEGELRERARGSHVGGNCTARFCGRGGAVGRTCVFDAWGFVLVEDGGDDAVGGCAGGGLAVCMG